MDSRKPGSSRIFTILADLLLAFLTPLSTLAYLQKRARFPSVDVLYLLALLYQLDCFSWLFLCGLVNSRAIKIAYAGLKASNDKLTVTRVFQETTRLFQSENFFKVILEQVISEYGFAMVFFFCSRAYHVLLILFAFYSVYLTQHQSKDDCGVTEDGDKESTTVREADRLLAHLMPHFIYARYQNSRKAAFGMFVICLALWNLQCCYVSYGVTMVALFLVDGNHKQLAYSVFISLLFFLISWSVYYFTCIRWSLHLLQKQEPKEQLKDTIKMSEKSAADMT